MDTLTFSMHKTTDGRFYFNLKDHCRRKLLTSKNYFSTGDCLCDIYRIQRYRDFTLTDEPPRAPCRYRFSLQTTSGFTIAKSAVYCSSVQLQQDKATVEAHIITAAIEDYSTTVRFFRPVSRA
jgi:uncharacterized protein YegP (UPF0339 family)